MLKLYPVTGPKTCLAGSGTQSYLAKMSPIPETNVVERTCAAPRSYACRPDQRARKPGVPMLSAKTAQARRARLRGHASRGKMRLALASDSSALVRCALHLTPLRAPSARHKQWLAPGSNRFHTLDAHQVTCMTSDTRLNGDYLQACSRVFTVSLYGCSRILTSRGDLETPSDVSTRCLPQHAAL